MYFTENWKRKRSQWKWMLRSSGSMCESTSTMPRGRHDLWWIRSFSELLFVACEINFTFATNFYVRLAEPSRLLVDTFSGSYEEWLPVTTGWRSFDDCGPTFVSLFFKLMSMRYCIRGPSNAHWRRGFASIRINLIRICELWQAWVPIQNKSDCQLHHNFELALPVFGEQGLPTTSYAPNHGDNSAFMITNSSVGACMVCEGHSHRINSRTRFLSLSPGDRFGELRWLELCRKCHAVRVDAGIIPCCILLATFQHISKANTLLRILRRCFSINGRCRPFFRRPGSFRRCGAARDWQYSIPEPLWSSTALPSVA